MKAGGQREKGKRMERRIATLIRERFPGVEVKRASQAERAYQSDVFTVGHPALDRIWWEITDGRQSRPDRKPLGKLLQAERDIAPREGTMADAIRAARVPVCAWHKQGARESWATMRAHTLFSFLHCKWRCGSCQLSEQRDRMTSLVTLDLVEFLELLR